MCYNTWSLFLSTTLSLNTSYYYHPSTHWYRNFKHGKKVQKGKRRRKQNTLQSVRSLEAPQVSNINCYVTQMLAASLGLKLFDITRRILMYTKDIDDYKHIYAVLRGTYPIHELCGTMTIILLARRDVLGVNLSMWKILAPAVFIHAMANFRGMKVSNVFSCCILSHVLFSWSHLPWLYCCSNFVLLPL